MKPHSILLVLLCCLFGAITASAGSPGGTHVHLDTVDSSTPLLPPATTDPAVLHCSRVRASFAGERFLETVAISCAFLAFMTSTGCSSPGLLTAALIFIALMYLMKLAFNSARTGCIHGSSDVAAGSAHAIPDWQLSFSLLVAAVDACRAVALFSTALEQEYCGVGTHSTAASISYTLMVMMLLGFFQLAMLHTNMHIYLHDLTRLFPAEALQDEYQP